MIGVESFGKRIEIQMEDGMLVQRGVTLGLDLNLGIQVYTQPRWVVTSPVMLGLARGSLGVR